MDRMKINYLILKQNFTDDSSVYKLLTPTKKILNVLPPVIDKKGENYFLTILNKHEDDEDIYLILYSKCSFKGAGVDKLDIGMCTSVNAESIMDIEKLLLSIAKEIKSTFHVKANRKLAKTFIEEIYKEQ